MTRTPASVVVRPVEVFTDFGWPLHIIANKQTKKLISAASFVCSLFVCCAASFVFVCSLGYPHPQNLTSLRREYPSANFVKNSSGPHSCIGEGYRNHTNFSISPTATLSIPTTLVFRKAMYLEANRGEL
jgi:hypothetical protein